MRVNDLLNIIEFIIGSHIYAPGVLAMESNTHMDENVNIYTGKWKMHKGRSA